MLIIGLTGIIGSGKSTVARIIQKHFKYLVIDADKIGHELLGHDPKIMAKVIQAFGTNQRGQLAKIVFNNPPKLRQLNKITHPAIRKRVKDIIQLNKNEKVIVIEAALLFTIGLHRYCQKIVFVDAKPPEIIKRLSAKGLSPKAIRLRLKANQQVYTCQPKCQYDLVNNGSRRELIQKVVNLFSNI